MSDRTWIALFCIIGSGSLFYFLTRGDEDDVLFWSEVAHFFDTGVLLVLIMAISLAALLGWHGFWLIATRGKRKRK